MEFGCSICEYTSSQKICVIRHINRKKSCGPGIKKVIEIPIDIICQYCNKTFSTKDNLKDHIKNNCKHKDDAKDEEIRKLKEELKKAKTVTINNNNNTFIIVNNYENTSLEKLTDKDYNKIIKNADEIYQIIPRFIQAVHFNPNIPENHNIALSNRNKNNKHLQIYRNGHLEIVDKNTEIDNLISDKETNLSDWVAEKGDKYPEAQEKYKEYLEQKYDNEESNSKSVKDSVELQ